MASMLSRAARQTRALRRIAPRNCELTTSSRTKASAASAFASPSAAPPVEPVLNGKRPRAQQSASGASLDALHGLSLDAEPNTQRVAIDAIGPNSFTVNGVRVRGSLLLLPHLATFWNVDQTTDICPDAFVLLKLHIPRPDMVVLGTGTVVHPMSSKLYKFFRDLGVRFDVLSTKNACQTFNVLNQEGRLVAAALLPASTPPPSVPGAAKTMSHRSF